MREGSRVEIFRWGESILAIEPDMLAGDGELSEEDCEAIYRAGEHLIAFAGDPEKGRPFTVGERQ